MKLRLRKSSIASPIHNKPDASDRNIAKSGIDRANRHTGAISTVAFTPNGQRLVSGSWDCQLKVWDVETATVQLTLNAHSAGVNSIAIARDGKQMVSVGWDGRLNLWNWETTGREIGEIVRSGRFPYKKTFWTDLSPICGVVFSADGTAIVSGAADNTLAIWDVTTGKIGRIFTSHRACVNAVAITPDGQQIVSGSWDKTLKIWSVKTGKERLTLRGHEGSVQAIAIAPDSQYMVSASWDNTLKIWELATGKECFTILGHRSGVNAVAVTPDGRHIVSASSDQTLKVWNFASGDLLADWTGECSMLSCAVAPDGKTIAVGDRNGQLHILQLEKF